MEICTFGREILRGEVCPVLQTGVRLDNDRIHPSIFHRVEVGTLCECKGKERERERGSDEKKIFSSFISFHFPELVS